MIDFSQTNDVASDDDWRNTTIDDAQAQVNPKVAQAVERITELRQSIDNVDAAIISLLAERFTYTAEVGKLKAAAGFAPEDREREQRQAARLNKIAVNAGLDPSVEEHYLQFVVTEAKRCHQWIAESGAESSC